MLENTTQRIQKSFFFFCLKRMYTIYNETALAKPHLGFTYFILSLGMYNDSISTSQYLNSKTYNCISQGTQVICMIIVHLIWILKLRKATHITEFLSPT